MTTITTTIATAIITRILNYNFTSVEW